MSRRLERLSATRATTPSTAAGIYSAAAQSVEVPPVAASVPAATPEAGKGYWGRKL